MNADAKARWSPDWSNAVFSLEERDRRWAKVRGLMARAGIDVLICLPHSANHDRAAADARYLSQLGENSDEATVAFPIEGEVVAWHMRGGIWPSSNWFDQIPNAFRGRGGATISAWLKDNPRYQKSKIGICGLDSGLLAHVRSHEGEVNWRSVEILKKEWPGATFVSATELMGEARFQKSAEEIEFVRKGTRIAEITLDAVKASARAGVSERLVFAEMMYANAKAGGSFTPMVGWVSGPLGATYHRLEQPSFRDLRQGDTMILEIDGRWGGYIAQIDHSLMVGPAPQELMDCWKLVVESFQRVFERMKPGVTIGELAEAGTVTGLSGRAKTMLLLHGRGTGDDGPLYVPGPQPDGMLDLQVREHCTFVIKPWVILDGRPDYCRFGESVVVTANGCERLGSRACDLIELN